MFEVHCARHGCRVLLSTNQMRRMRQLAGGDILVEWRCWCGHVGRSLNGQPLDKGPARFALVPGSDDLATLPDAS